MEDSIWRPASEQQESQAARLANYNGKQFNVVRRHQQAGKTNSQKASEMAPASSHYELLKQQQQSALGQNSRQYHDNNNNNNGNNNSSKVKLLITPATNYGSGKQQMIHSSATATLANVPNPKQQHQLQPRSHTLQNGLKNYHHYDYYHASDSNCASQRPLQQQQANHYEENILLFATEHDRQAPMQVPALERQRATAEQQQVSAGCPPPTTQHRQIYQGATGKFVNHYASWRRAQSPSGGANYSFHVPTYLQQAPISGQRRRAHSPAQARNLQYQESGFGFVAPAELVSSNRPSTGFNQSFRSRTIAHIPNMVKLTTTAHSNGAQRQPSSGDFTPSTYEDFYERPTVTVSSSSAGFVGKSHLMRSAGDLLKVHVIEFERPLAELGADNPFKPGTELSWEADMMVRLMKRGYPVDELPVLVQTAKQVALDKQRAANKSQPSAKSAISAKSPNELSGNRSQQEQQQQRPSETNGTCKRTSEASTTLNVEEQAGRSAGRNANELVRRQSSSELNSAKQAWANSLQRAKSMPRFAASARAEEDSIDRLITSIENETSTHLLERASSSNELSSTSSPGREGGSLRETTAITKVPSNRKINSNNKDSKGNVTKRKAAASKGGNRQHSAKAKRLAIVKDGNKNAKAEPESNNIKEADLNRYNKKIKKKDKRRSALCCIIQ